MKTRLASLLALVVIGVVAERAEAQPIVQGRLLVSSHYDFRGVPQNEKGVIQPEIGLEVPTSVSGRLELTTWGNIDMSDDTGSAVLPGSSGGHLSEIDFTLAYAHRVGPAAMILGATSYNFPGGGPATTEAHIGVTGSVLGFSPHITAYRDIDLVRGLYLNGGVTRTDALGGRLASELSVTLGLTDAEHAEVYYGVRDTGLADLAVGVSLAWTSRDATAAIEFHHARLPDGDKRSALRRSGLDVQSSWAGLSLAKRF